MKNLTQDELNALLYKSPPRTKKEKNKDHQSKKKAAIDLLKSQPCMDCGNTYPPYVMEFDHREGRNGARPVSVLITKLGIERLLEEIAKCDIVCANCHKIRTHNRRTNS